MTVLPRQLPLGLRIGITLLLLGLFYFASRVPLPFVHTERLAERFPADSMARASVIALGINPLITGFLVVELGALLLSAGRRLRAGGEAGRQKLNGLALGLSLVVSATQAAGIALLFERVSSYGSMQIVENPGWLFRMILVCTLMAVTVALYWIGNLITTWGIGNGFCLLWLVSSLKPLLNHPESLRAADDRTYLSFLILAVGLALLFYRVQTIEVSEEGTATLTVPLPALPQSMVPLGIASFLVGLALPTLQVVGSSRFTGPILAALATLLFSLLFFSWLGSRQRILGSLPSGVTLEAGADVAIRRQLTVATVLLVGLPLLLFAAKDYGGLAIEILPLSTLLFAVATALDLYNHVRFLSNHAAVRLLGLDSVHLAAYLERRLDSHGIPALVQGYRARSLFLLFQPLFTMDLLVPAERFAEARALVAQEVEEDLRAF